MSLSARTKKVVQIALADLQAATELNAAVDTAVAGEAQALAATDSPTFAALTLTSNATVGGDVKIASGHGVKVNNIQVLGTQGALIADVTPAADGTAVGTAFNTLLARLRAHGIIAT